MARVTVHNSDGEKCAPSVSEKLAAIRGRIRQRAYEIFQHRDSVGSASYDWLLAEEQLTLSTSPELVEKEGKVELKLPVPGFDAGDIDVTVMPDSIIVIAESSHREKEEKNNLHSCEYTGKVLMRQIPLPYEI